MKAENAQASKPIKIISLLSLILSFRLGYSQDTIHLINGKQLFGKVAEISSEEIKYKKLNNMDGPVYIEFIKDIRSINYQNGTQDVFNKSAEIISTGSASYYGKQTDSEAKPEIKNTDKPWLIPDAETGDSIKDSKEFQKPWLVPETKSETRQKENTAAIPANSGNVLSVYVPGTPKNNPDFFQVGDRYWYDQKMLNEFEMQKVLFSVNDPKITMLLNTANTQKKQQYIGFAAIPCGIAGVAMIGLANGSSNSFQGDESLGAILIVAAATTFTASITLKCMRTNNNKAALKLYNQNY